MSELRQAVGLPMMLADRRSDLGDSQFATGAAQSGTGYSADSSGEIAR
jgi:hypothetical protein